MKLIVTGAYGNLGAHILKHLGEKSEIVSIGRGDLENKSQEIEDAEADTVFHLAADLKNRYDISPVQFVENNIALTASLLELARSKKIKRFVFASSAAVYGEKSECCENDFPTPSSINGMSKLMNEKLISGFCEAHDMDYRIYRIFNTYGGEDTFSVVKKIINSVRNGSEFTLYNYGTSKRDFVHVDDVAKIIATTYDIKLPWNILNIGTGRATSIMDMVEPFLGKMNIRYSSNNEVEYSVADIRRLKSLINFDFVDPSAYLKSELGI